MAAAYDSSSGLRSSGCGFAYTRLDFRNSIYLRTVAAACSMSYAHQKYEKAVLNKE